LVDSEKEARDRAEAMFKKQEGRRAIDAAEREAEDAAVREKTARLKALRLALKAAEADKDRGIRPSRSIS
jgi:hypothetical protein